MRKMDLTILPSPASVAGGLHPPSFDGLQQQFMQNWVTNSMEQIQTQWT